MSEYESFGIALDARISLIVATIILSLVFLRPIFALDCSLDNDINAPAGCDDRGPGVSPKAECDYVGAG